MRSRIGSRLGASLLVGLLAFGPACGGASRDAESVRAPASADGYTFTFVWEVEGVARENRDVRALAAEVESELQRVGFTLVPEDEPHDAELVVRFSMSPNTSLIVWKVGNKTVDDAAARARLRVRLDGATLLETEAIAFTYTTGQGLDEADELPPLVAELAESPGFAYVARRLKQRRDERAAEADWLAEEEEAIWRVEVLELCSQARGPADCQKLDDWMLAHRRKVDLADRWLEARAAREKAEPRLEALRDREAWRGASPLECEAKVDPSACRGVAAYLRERPAGLHATEAKALLEKAESAQAAARAGEEAEARRQAAVLDAERREAAAAGQARAAEQERANRRAQCRGACRSSCARFLDQVTFEGCRATCLAACP